MSAQPNENFQELRKEYQTDGIDDEQMLDDPIEQFRVWFDAAVEASPGEWFEPNAMTLATADSSGAVTARVVLLKGVESKTDGTEGSIRFFTNYGSTKGQQLANNPVAAVVFNWAHQGRQVRIEGSVEKTTRQVSESYFHSRPRGAQLGAVASKQSSKIASRKQLQDARDQLDKELEGQPVPLPENWGGYQLTPTKVEFWQGRLDRLHDRVVYEREGQTWRRSRISP
jgi:pyridoxamine 5'-phosphate oxidase